MPTNPTDDVIERALSLSRSLTAGLPISRSFIVEVLSSMTSALRTAREDTRRLEEAIANALRMASGRWSEWGDRAEATADILSAAIAAEEGD